MFCPNSTLFPTRLCNPHWKFRTALKHWVGLTAKPGILGSNKKLCHVSHVSHVSPLPLPAVFAPPSIAAVHESASCGLRKGQRSEILYANMSNQSPRWTDSQASCQCVNHNDTQIIHLMHRSVCRKWINMAETPQTSHGHKCDKCSVCSTKSHRFELHQPQNQTTSHKKYSEMIREGGLKKNHQVNEHKKSGMRH